MSSLTEVRDIAIIHAPLDRVWALSTRVELVRSTLGMQLVSGPERGSIADGSRVLWRGWKFGLPTEHHTLITGFKPPHDISTEAGQPAQREAWFQDSQERGRFAFFQHDHAFHELCSGSSGTVTILGDHVQFSLPLLLGSKLSATALMKPYVTNLVRRRFAAIKELAEGDGWRAWV